ncbi:MAG: Peptidoglycan-binding lysin domain protein [Clostridia bacterium]|nr:Peptidoglycan-binding lysin domain protein [Clostridia bacterium]
MKNYMIKSTVIIALVLAFFAAFATITYADGNIFKKGERSNEIAEIQNALKELKLFDEEATGYFGQVTEEAVKKFQKLKNLTADGVVGPSTLQALLGKSSITATSRAVVERKKVNVPYTIKEGDTIWDIAEDFNVTRDSILKYNKLSEDSVLKIGKKIVIPNVIRDVVKIIPIEKVEVKESTPVPTAVADNSKEVLTDLPDNICIVKEGDTLSSIAEDYGVTVKALADLNGIAEDAVLKIEQELKIPEEAKAAPQVDSDSKAEDAELKGEYLGWFDKVQYIFEKNDVAVVTDVKTGKTFKVKRLYGRNHADVEPLTKEDAATMKSIYGSWSWDRRAVIVTIDGKNIAGSMNGMPHGGEQIKDNNFKGHFCIHFKGSKTHSGNRVDATHQAAVKMAAGIK